MVLKVNKKYKRVIQLEFNEISADVVGQIIQRHKTLKNFAKINHEWKFLHTSSEVEYDNIEPWIQWVTAHTGKELSEHGVFNLSDVHKLTHPQIWETLSEHGVESGIIGSMNTIRRNTSGGMFFSDPWSQSNETYPDEIKPLWSFIAAKVQQHATTKLTFKELLEAMRICRKIGLPRSLYVKVIRQVISQKLNPKTKWKLAGIFDLFLSEVFKSILKSTDYGFYTLFINAIAHYQHHYWRAFDSQYFNSAIKYSDIRQKDNPILFGYEIYDKIIGDILKITAKDQDTLIIILSGLSQVPYTLQEDEGGMNYYRLNSHKNFAKMIGLNGTVYPMMSRDWQYKYESEEEHKAALNILGSLTVNGQKLFILTESTPGYIYVETGYTKGVDKNTQIELSGKSIGLFNDLFTNIAIKSGHHTGIGNLWISDLDAVDIPSGNTIALSEVYHLGINALVQG